MKSAPISWGRMFLVILFTAVVGSCCQKEGPSSLTPKPPQEIWRFAIEEISGSVQDTYAQKFKEKIEAKSRGGVRVIIYPYGSLGTSDQITELVHMGVLEFAMASPGHLGKVVPEVQLLLLHFIFSEHNAANQALLGKRPAFMAALDRAYRRKGLKLLALYPEGWQVWTTKRPIRKPSDFQGLKIRVMTSPILIEAYKAYGANPTPLPYSEVYSALQLNMIDGQVNPVFAIEEMSFYEVTDYMVFARHALFVTSVVTNPAFLSNLSLEKRHMIRETLAELYPYIFRVQEELNRQRLEKIRAQKPDLKIIRLTAKEREAFRQASLPVRQKYVEMAGPLGKEILDQLLQEVARAEARLERDSKGFPP